MGYKFDNGNWEFTNRTIEWLKGGGPEPRTRCLFIEDGNIIDKFAIEIPQPPKPPIPNLPPEVLANILLNSMNPIIEEAQERDFFNRMVESIFGVPRLLRWFFIILTVILIVSGVRWLMRGQRKIEPTATMTPTQQSSAVAPRRRAAPADRRPDRSRQPVRGGVADGSATGSTFSAAGRGRMGKCRRS